MAMEWIPDAVQVVGTILGAGAVTALVQGWNKRKDAQEDRKTKAQVAHQEDRKDAVGILREALAEERKDHASCQERVTVVEAAMFREREGREQERRECAEEVSKLRDLVLEAYTSSTPPARQDPQLLQRLRKLSPPVPMGAVVDPRERKG